MKSDRVIESAIRAAQNLLWQNLPPTHKLPDAAAVARLRDLVRSLGGRFPCGLALGSHLVFFHFDYLTPATTILRPPSTTASWCLSLFFAEEKIAEAGLSKQGELRSR